MKKIGIVIIALIAVMILPAIKADAAILMDGSTPYANVKFDAVVYWRVYSPLDSASPLGSISDYGYYYQVRNAGTGGDKAITQLGVDNQFNVPSTSIGYLTTVNLDSLSGSVAPSVSYYDIDNSGIWSFTPGSISLGSDSYLLYFTSPIPPTMVNGGVQAGSYNTQAPIPGLAPEPASAALLGIGIVGLVGSLIRKKFMA